MNCKLKTYIKGLIKQSMIYLHLYVYTGMVYENIQAIHTIKANLELKK